MKNVIFKLPSYFFPCVFWGVLYSSTVSAESFDFQVEPQLMRFQYTEYDESGSQLVQEQGNIYGIDVALKNSITSNLSLGILGQYFDGSVDYDGATQIGATHTTSTEQKITNLGIALSYQFYSNTTFVFKYSTHAWQRAIQPKASVAGLDENYYWRELNAGTSYKFNIDNTQSIEVEASVISILSPEIEIMLPDYDTQSLWLSLGEKLGGSFKLSYSKQIAPKLALTINANYRYFSFGKSKVKNITKGGRTYAIHEPKSISEYISAGFGINYIF